MLLTGLANNIGEKQQPCPEGYHPALVLPSLEFVYLTDMRIDSYSLRGDYCFGNMRYINISYNKLTKSLCEHCQIVGANRLEIIDLSYGELEVITSAFFTLPKLRFLNLSHNALGVSGSHFQETFSNLNHLVDINLSSNRLSRISPSAFDHCTHLRRVDLADNELTHIDFNLRHLPELKHMDLSGNRLLRLSDAFTAKLDKASLVRPLELNVQREMFVCNCESALFVQWIRKTHVRLPGRDQLTCMYEGDDNMLLKEIAIDKIKADCAFPVMHVVVPVVVGLLIVVGLVTVAVLVYRRWYARHNLMPKRRAEEDEQAKPHETVLLYVVCSPISDSDQCDVGMISHHIDTGLMSPAEEASSCS